MNQEKKLKEEIESYWKTFLSSHPEYNGKKYSAWHFCDNKKDANQLADLALRGIKKGTTSLLKSYRIEKEPLPEEGDLSIVTGWEGNPECVIETIRIYRMPFREVTRELAEIEGEGDKSLEYWREAHIDAFTREAQELGFTFTEELTILFEEFRVIYK